jgi:hypothetical protein
MIFIQENLLKNMGLDDKHIYEIENIHMAYIRHTINGEM